MNVRKIRLTDSLSLRGFDHTHLTQLDNALWKLVDRPQYELRLEVEFRVVCWGVTNGVAELEKCLPRFHEKGRVRAIDTEDRLIYCSDEAKRW